MSNGTTGFWAATGAFLGGIAGAQAGKYAIEARPRFQYTSEPGDAPPRRRPGGAETEDAMVIGGAIGAIVGAFVAGTVAGEPQAPPAPAAPATGKVAGVGEYYFP